MSQRTLLAPGVRSLQNFLQKELPNLQRSPVLVVSSEPAASGGIGSSILAVKDASRWVNLTLSQNLGLRTVPATISSAVPSIQDVESRLEMVRRTGASSIIAVGSGAAMDLAKALAATAKNDSIEQLILVPSTHAATIAAGTTHSLLLDSIEETLVLNRSSITCPTTVAPLDPKYTAAMDVNHVVCVAVALILDACLRKSTNPHLEEMISKLHTLVRVQGQPTIMTHEEMMTLCYRSGNLLSYGLGSEDRSAPIALASSLIPCIFPHVHILAFWENLIPGLWYAVTSTSSDALPVLLQDLVESILAKGDWKKIPPLTVVDETMKGFSIPDMALSHIQSNGALCKTYDLPNQLLIDILQHSLTDLAAET
jgi:hypothetical protein